MGRILPVEAAAPENREIMVFGPVKTTVALLLLFCPFKDTETSNWAG